MNLLVALAILVPLAVLAWKLGAVRPDGAIAGILIGLALAWTATPAPFATFLLFVVLGSLGTRLGAARKQALGVAQKEGGRRGWSHALANAGPSALLVLLARLDQGARPEGLVEMMACGGLAAVLADTCASEFGQWLAARPRSILSWRVVPVGVDGGVSPAGLVAAALAAFACGLVATPWFGAGILPILGLAGFGGNLVDSVLGATVEPWLGRHGGALVNAAAALAGIGGVQLMLA
ncbi:MAG: DUF92 domain-containing protein [Planctomycetes bacterium]|nr:DUF92 domain-containing protein [Planctomycetota bacterium]